MFNLFPLSLSGAEGGAPIAARSGLVWGQGSAEEEAQGQLFLDGLESQSPFRGWAEVGTILVVVV